jgi:hypothetical protein
MVSAPNRAALAATSHAVAGGTLWAYPALLTVDYRSSVSSVTGVSLVAPPLSGR